jgi:hypothetical protein
MPYRPFTIAILLRAAGSWIAVRVAMLMLQGMYGIDPSLALSALASLGVIVTATIIVLFDLSRLNERLFLGNLGVRTGALVALAALPPASLEAATTALAS